MVRVEWRKTYASWQQIHQRCSNPNRPHWARYGGRGIKVCAEWKAFMTFLDDMGAQPEGKTLDRIDNDGPYCKSNCRWATQSEQQLNKGTRSNTGVQGVHWQRQKSGVYIVANTKRIEGVVKCLYAGSDLFEAVCARKSWEVHRDSVS